MVLLLAVLLLGSFCLALAHHHEDGQMHQDCLLCRVVALFTAWVFAAALLLLDVKRPQFRFSSSEFPFQSLFRFSNLKGRAPPALPVF